MFMPVVSVVVPLLPFMPDMYMPIVVIMLMLVLWLLLFTPEDIINTTVFATTVAVSDASNGNCCISSVRIVVICSFAIESLCWHLLVLTVSYDHCDRRLSVFKQRRPPQLPGTRHSFLKITVVIIAVIVSQLCL